MHKIWHLLLAAALLAVLVGLSMRGTAHAASLQQAQPQVTCSPGGGCDGQDPVATGCDYDAYTVTSQDINGLGLVELRYSPTCGTNWARVTSYPSTAYPYLYGDVISNTSGKMICYPTDCMSGINGTLLWTSMVYSPDPYSAFADGCVNMACAQTALG